MTQTGSPATSREPRGRSGRDGRLAQRAAAFAIGLVALSLAIVLWTYAQSREALRLDREQALRTLLDVKTEALLGWFETRRAGGAPTLRQALTGAAGETRLRLAAILVAARPGESGDAFVFDPEARVLTEPRFAAPARAQAGATSALQLREPAGDGAAPTRLAAHALEARANPQAPQQGELLEPYRSYAGQEVIGAWRWLPQHDLGIAVELGADEAYGPLRYFHQGLIALLALLAVGWFALFLPPGAWQRLRGGGQTRVGPYVIERQIGEGGLSNIYVARHKMLIRPVALKVLKPHAASDEMLARFEREVQLTSQLEHPCTIEIFDYGRTRDGIFYCAMELLDGFSVGELVERHGPQPPGRVAHLLRQVCGSLAEAHAKGMVHRDIKPQNIMVCTRAGLRDAVKLLDFGLVKNLAAHATRDLTRNLRILGTPLYMAPERINDPARVDARADLYALAAVAFLMLTGRRVFEADNDEDLIRQVLHAAPPRAAALAPEDVPAMLDALIARCLAKDPAQRPASVAEFDAVLAAVLGERPWTRRQIDAWWARQRSEPAPATTVQARE